MWCISGGLTTPGGQKACTDITLARLRRVRWKSQQKPTRAKTKMQGPRRAFTALRLSVNDVVSDTSTAARLMVTTNHFNFVFRVGNLILITYKIPSMETPPTGRGFAAGGAGGGGNVLMIPENASCTPSQWPA